MAEGRLSGVVWCGAGASRRARRRQAPGARSCLLVLAMRERETRKPKTIHKPESRMLTRGERGGQVEATKRAEDGKRQVRAPALCQTRARGCD
eukprot:2160399-Rhodomonas_salina.2